MPNWNVPHARNIWVYIAIQGGRLSISLEEHKRKQLCNFFLAVGSSLFLSLLSVLVIYFIHKCKCQLQWKEWCLLWMLCRTEQPVHDLWGDQTCHYVGGILRTGKLRKPLGKFRNEKNYFWIPARLKHNWSICPAKTQALTNLNLSFSLFQYLDSTHTIPPAIEKYFQQFFFSFNKIIGTIEDKDIPQQKLSQGREVFIATT